jgi:hypothetical protein
VKEIFPNEKDLDSFTSGEGREKRRKRKAKKDLFEMPETDCRWHFWSDEKWKEHPRCVLGKGV